MWLLIKYVKKIKKVCSNEKIIIYKKKFKINKNKS